MNRYWMWEYGEYERYHAYSVSVKRQEYGVDMPVFWDTPTLKNKVNYFYDVVCNDDSYITVYAKGTGYVTVNKTVYPFEEKILLHKGENNIVVYVANLGGIPCAYIQSDTLPSGEGWYTIRDGKKQPVGYNKSYSSLEDDPHIFPFAYTELLPVQRQNIRDGIFFDFGKELFGYLDIFNILPADNLYIAYGESKEEALDIGEALLFESVTGFDSYRLTQRAFRYIFIKGSNTVQIKAQYEYLPLETKGNFSCSSDDINKIWDLCAYTYHLCCREMFLDGIKRDRWIWSGDAFQAYKINNYLFFDKDSTKRSILALMGNEPYTQHINTITDYSFLWVISLLDYYTTFGDFELIEFCYPKAVSLMDFASKRVNKEGFIIQKNDDWIFIDWSDMDKTGALCAEQILYLQATRVMAKLASVINKDGRQYVETSESLLQKINQYFWREEKGAFIDSYESGKENVTRHANIFAILFDVATDKQTEQIVKNVLENDAIKKITTPYFEGYELDVMGKLGRYDYIENMLHTYWKGMLDLGTTTIWEEYNPTLSGIEHYAMYDKKYGKSLCHIWGATPIYLLARYYLGVYPTEAGYKSFCVKPNRGGLKEINGVAPVNGGLVHLSLSDSFLKVTATVNGGILLWNNQKYPLIPGKEICLDI